MANLKALLPSFSHHRASSRLSQGRRAELLLAARQYRLPKPLTSHKKAQVAFAPGRIISISRRSPIVPTVPLRSVFLSKRGKTYNLVFSPFAFSSFFFGVGNHTHIYSTFLKLYPSLFLHPGREIYTLRFYWLPEQFFLPLFSVDSACLVHFSFALIGVVLAGCVYPGVVLFLHHR